MCIYIMCIIVYSNILIPASTCISLACELPRPAGTRGRQLGSLTESCAAEDGW